MLVLMISYFMGKQRGYYNPLILSITSLALFFIFTPLAGGYEYFGTQGALLAMIISLTSSELFIKLSKNKKLRINVGDNVPEAVKNSFNTIIIIIILICLYSLIATILSVVTGMEAIGDNLRCCCAVRIDEVMSFVSLIVTLDITIAKWKLDCSLIRLLTEMCIRDRYKPLYSGLCNDDGAVSRVRCGVCILHGKV